jgi:hypothetical protein
VLIERLVNEMHSFTGATLDEMRKQRITTTRRATRANQKATESNAQKKKRKEKAVKYKKKWAGRDKGTLLAISLLTIPKKLRIFVRELDVWEGKRVD